MCMCVCIYILVILVQQEPNGSYGNTGDYIAQPRTMYTWLFYLPDPPSIHLFSPTLISKYLSLEAGNYDGNLM